MGPKRKQLFVWQCCQCGQGGIPIRADGCRQCDMPRCAYCPVSKVRIRGATETTSIPRTIDLRIGDSVGFEGGDTFAALGPMLECSGRRYFLVPANLFIGARLANGIPYDVKLVHPAEVDCPEGVRPRVIGVFRYWSGPINQTHRISNWTKRAVITNWALCQVVHDGFQMQNLLRYAPPTGLTPEASTVIPGIFKKKLSCKSALVIGRKCELSKAFICETPASVQVRHRENEDVPLTHEWYTRDADNFSDEKSTATQHLKKDNGAVVVDADNCRLIGLIWGVCANEKDKKLQGLSFFSSILDIMDDIREKHPVIGWPFLVDQTDPRLFEPTPPAKGIFSRDNSLMQDFGTSSPTQNDRGAYHGSIALQPETTEGDYESDVISVFSATSEFESNTSNSSIRLVEVQALRQAVLELFLADLVISDSFRDALAPRGIGSTAVTMTLRSGLREMGNALMVESNTIEQIACARRVRRDAKYISDSVRRKYAPESEIVELNINNSKLPMSREDQRRHLMNWWLRSQALVRPEVAGQSGKLPEELPEAQSHVQMEGLAEFYEDSDISEDDPIDPEAENELSVRILELRGFILHSEHMESLRNKLRQAANRRRSPAKDAPRGSESNIQGHLKNHGPEARENTATMRLLPEIVDRWFPQWLDSFWEPPISQGTKRVRWTCACGKRLYDDYHGLEEEQLKRLRTTLHRSKPPGNGQQPVEGSAMENWASRATNWTKSVLSAAANAFRRSPDGNNSIPLHNPITSHPPTDLPAARNSPRNNLFLLFSLQAGGEGSAHILRHATVELAKLENDNDLFRFLRQRFHAERKFTSRISLRTVSGIGNCMFRVDCSNFIQSLQRHTTACPAHKVFGCDCWPPAVELPQYRYIPQAPTEPFLMEKNYLLHHFRNPGCLDPKQTSVIRYIPMKKNCKLVGEASKPVTGWGIYFEEDWHWKTIFVVITVLMIIVSIVLGLTWWFVKSDFSGGWGVASFCVTSATLLVTVLGFMAHKSY